MHAKHLGIPWDGPLTPESNSLPGLPGQQWSAHSWVVEVIVEVVEVIVELMGVVEVIEVSLQMI